MTDVLIQSLAGRLLTGSLEGAVVIAAIWALCRFLPAIPPAVQSALWWVAALKLIVALLPLPAISVPLLPVDGTGVMVASAPAGPDVTAGASAARITLPADRRTTPSGTTAASFSWARVVVALWLAVVLVHAGRLAIAAHRLRGVVARAVPLPADEAAAIDRMAAAVSLSRRPDVRTSPEIDAPQVAGIACPIVLLPARPFESAERAMMLCHELMHIRRRDLAWGWVPALAERLFFFHPLARLAAREYVVTREAACDAAVVRALRVAPGDYGRMLFRLGLSSGEPALTAGSAPASRASLKRRLEMLHHVPTDNAARRAIWLPAVVACTLIPLQLGARSPHTGSESQGAPPATAARPVTEAPPASSPRLVQQAIDERRVARERADARGQREAVARIPDDQDAATAQRQIERSLQELTEQYRRRLAEMGTPLDAQGLVRDGSAAGLRELIERLRESERALWQRADEFVRRGLKPTHPDLVAARRAAAETARTVRELELAEEGARLVRKVEQAERGQGDRATTSLRDQLERLVSQQEELGRQLEQIADQQRAIAGEQQRLSEEAERLRRELEAR